MISVLNSLLNLILSGFEAILSGIGDIAVSSVKGSRKEQYNADFIPVGKVLFSNETGFCLTGNRSLTVKDSYSNAVVFGGSGSGKSSVVLIPSILKMANSSNVIHDPSGELYQQTSGALKEKGYLVKALNYANPEYSENYNPLERVKTVSDIKKISKLLVHTSLGGNAKDPFWNNTSETLLTVFLRYILFHTEKQYHSLYNVLHLLNAFSGTPQKVDKLFVEAKDDELLDSYKAFIAYDNKMLMSIVATARTSLALFADPNVAQVTSKDSIDFESFRKEKTVLFINNNVSDMKYYSVISSIFFEQFFAATMQQLPTKNDLPIFFLLDEASSLYLSILPTAISNIRKYNAGVLQIYQSQHQLFDLYGIPQGRNIVANSFAKVYMPGQPLETCRELELLLGKFQYVDDNNHEKTRSLLSLDEIRILKESIILCGNMPPIKSKLIPFYEQRELNRLATLPPYTVPVQDYEEELQTIDVNPKPKPKPKTDEAGDAEVETAGEKIPDEKTKNDNSKGVILQPAVSQTEKKEQE